MLRSVLGMVLTSVFMLGFVPSMNSNRGLIGKRQLALPANASLELVSLPQAVVGSMQAALQIGSAVKVTQLRLFTINRGQLDVFLDAWLKGVFPLRIRQGFRIEGAWVNRERNEFLWILSYDGPEGFAAKDSAYYASESRQSLNPDPRQYIAKVESWFLTPVLPAGN